MRAHTHVNMYIYIDLYIHIHTYLYAHTIIFIYTYIHTYLHTHTHTLIYITVCQYYPSLLIVNKTVSINVRLAWKWLTVMNIPSFFTLTLMEQHIFKLTLKLFCYLKCH